MTNPITTTTPTI